MKTPHLLTSLPFLMLPILAGCGGGSGAGNPAGGSSATAELRLFTSTRAGAEDVLEAQVVGVVAEYRGGELSPNLLPNPTDWIIADPVGSTTGLRLRRPDRVQDAVALRVVFAADGLLLRLGDRTEVVHVAGNEMELAWRGTFAAAGDLALSIAHRGPLSLTRDAAGRRVWTPDWTVLVADDAPLEGLEAVVMSVDLQQGDLLAVLPTMQDLPITVEFPPEASLRRDDGTQVRLDEFLRLCQGSDRLLVDAIRTRSNRLQCRGARHQGRGGEFDEVYARVVSVDAGSQMLQADLLVRRRDGVLSTPAVVRRTIDGSRATVFAERHGPAVPFSNLVVGAWIEVHFAREVGDTLIATRIEIEDDHQLRGRHELEGAVLAVDVATRRITVGPRRDDPLWFRGQSVTRLFVDVPTTAAIYRRGDRLVAIELGGIVPGERIDVRGEPTGEDSLTATYVRVRTDR